VQFELPGVAPTFGGGGQRGVDCHWGSKRTATGRAAAPSDSPDRPVRLPGEPAHRHRNRPSQRGRRSNALTAPWPGIITPDLNKDPGAEEHFKEISEAYEVLADPKTGARYDRFGSAWRQAPEDYDPPPAPPAERPVRPAAMAGGCM